MKKAIIMLAAMALLAAPAMADINFTYEGNNYTSVAQVWLSNAAWHGGPFQVNLVSGSLPDANPFNTFCVESVITFYPGTTYYASIDNVVVEGTLGKDPGYTENLKAETAWIYSQYRAGNPGGYGAQTISEAIWFQQGQIGGVDNALAQAADGHAGEGLGNVRVLNLWTLTQNTTTGLWTATDVQSQLVQIPAPAAIGLGLIGLGLVGWVKRRLA